MTTKKQRELGINAKFISFALIEARRMYYSVRQDRHVTLVSAKKRNYVYGALFLLDYETNRYKLHSYHFNAGAFTGTQSKEDINILKKKFAIPISFKSLTELQNSKYEILKQVECFVFVGNEKNKHIKRAIKNRNGGRDVRNIDKKNFIILTKEVIKEEK